MIPLHAADILIVDDQPTNLAVLSRLLSADGFRVRAVTGGARAIEAALAVRPDCILLDVNMPGMDGFLTCETLLSKVSLKDVPIIFVTAHDDVEHKVRGFQAGARDYVTKPFQSQEVLARVRHQLRLTQLEGQLVAQNAQLAEANSRLHEAAAQKARMTAMLVHDLRSPLNVVGVVLSDDIDAEALVDARAAYAKLVCLTNDMLEMSRAEQSEDLCAAKRFDLAELLSRVTRLSQRVAATKAVQVHFEQAHAPVYVSGDVAQFDRVFSNLLDNALKFTPAHGSITLSLGTETGEGVEAGLCFVCVRVRDTGTGILPEDLPFIFDAYRKSTCGEDHGGFGLGLAIVARIVAQHGGRIRTHSQVGVGTEFKVLLPAEPLLLGAVV